MKLIHNITERRNKLGLTQKQLADLLGWTLRKLTSYERNERIPPLPEALELANALKTKVEDLFTLVYDDEKRPSVKALYDPPVRKTKKTYPKIEKED